MTHKPQRQTQIGALIAVVAAAAANEPTSPWGPSAASPEPSRARGDETAPGAQTNYAPKEQQ